MNDPTHDLLILGGGPAGSSAAITTCRAGLRVAVLERRALPRDRPGETLHPGIEPLLRRLGAWEDVEAAAYLRHEGVWKAGADGGPPQFEPYGRDGSGPWRGLQAPRRDFDDILLDVARRAGAEVHLGVAAEGVIKRNDRVQGLATSQGPIYASFTLDAGGGSHRLARMLGIPITHYSPPLVARYGYVRGECPVRDDAPQFRFGPEGWTWMARVGPGRYHWTTLSLDDPARPSGPPSEYADMIPEGPPRAENVTWRCADRLAGGGFFLLGDAAVVLDPAASHGVLRAVMTGMQAAHLTTDVLAGRVPVEEAADRYDRWLRGWFHHDREALRENYDQMFRERQGHRTMNW